MIKTENLFCNKEMEIVLRTGATFSDDKKYRYRLWHRWSEEVTCLMTICLNPSKATELKSDATVTRMVRRAKKWGFGGIEVCNMYALMSTDPAELYKEGVDPIGPNNAAELFAAAQVSSMILCGWGTHGGQPLPGWNGLDILEFLKHPNTVSLGVNSDGSPKHPLYVSYKTEPQQYGPTHVPGEEVSFDKKTRRWSNEGET